MMVLFVVKMLYALRVKSVKLMVSSIFSIKWGGWCTLFIEMAQEYYNSAGGPL